MSFTDIPFIFFFLPILLVLFYISRKINKQLSKIVIIIFSLFFYSWGSEKYIVLIALIMAGLVLLSQVGKHLKDSMARILTAVSVCIVISILLFFKYIGVLVPVEIEFPIGLSFFSFRAISFIIDSYKNENKRSVIDSFLYLSFFPQIVSGPIEKFNDFLDSESERFNLTQLSDGIWMFVLGMSKKVLIADSLSNMRTVLNYVLVEHSPAYFLWIMSVIYSLQLYFDFSGYSDMAVGVGEMLGYECKKNFDYPYMTRSVSEFWKRWHISLGTWFKDYVYIPMGGSRTDVPRQIINLFVVWALTGIWHGVTFNFLIWSMGYFILILIERYIIKPERIKVKVISVLYRVFTLVMINILWVVFSITDISKLGIYLSRMFGLSRLVSSDINVLILLNDYKWFLLVAFIFIFPIYPYFKNKIDEMTSVKKVVLESVMSIIMIAAFILSISFIMAGNNNPFIYSGF